VMTTSHSTWYTNQGARGPATTCGGRAQESLDKMGDLSLESQN
jgi:hypothetical protein